MRRSAILTLLIASTLGLIACSDETVDGHARAAASAGDDRRVAADATSSEAPDIKAVDEAAVDSAKAASGTYKMTSADHELDTKIENGRTKPQASPRNKSVGDATQY